ncbi:YiiX/YebB-like N1pC/P60 family cysteine hydrolase [Bacillus sp. FJAT-45350]|uniref:YiiX/YebB-like N1pC/P60 family cysteine hydrolase n=1 Tax=Bacillus sp. FJAT-45350 TaxID=2011014 RepID=UPI000BB89B6E|nr:YiiX/YebB-like N1pC/P60 family cysteine hydrolase [Bacillus sp. FJAT-45350]
MENNLDSVKIETGDIIFVKQNDLTSLLIRWLEKSPYSHVAIAINSNEIIEADILRRVKIRKMKYTSFKVMRVDLNVSQKKLLISCAKTFINNKYNYKGAIKWFFRLIINRKDDRDLPQRVYCSELVDYIYRCVGIVFYPERAPGDVLPSDLLNSPLVKEAARETKK